MYDIPWREQTPPITILAETIANDNLGISQKRPDPAKNATSINAGFWATPTRKNTVKLVTVRAEGAILECAFFAGWFFAGSGRLWLLFQLAFVMEGQIGASRFSFASVYVIAMFATDHDYETCRITEFPLRLLSSSNWTKIPISTFRSISLVIVSVRMVVWNAHLPWAWFCLPMYQGQGGHWDTPLERCGQMNITSIPPVMGQDLCKASIWL